MFSCVDDEVCDRDMTCQSLVPDSPDVCYFAFCAPDEAAALALFASVALLFWYVLQILMSLNNRN